MTLFISPPHIMQAKQLNLHGHANSSASHVVNNSQLPACQGEMEPFKDHPDTRGHICMAGLRNKPQQKQLGQLLAPTPG